MSQETELARRPRVQSAARTLQVLLAIASRPDGQAAKDIADSIGAPRQVVYHLLHTLASMEAVRKTASGRYMLGLGLTPLAEALRSQLSPPAQLAPIVDAVSRTTGETAYAVGWLDDEIVVLATASGHNPIKAAEVPLGYRGFGHARASGKLLLALASEEVRRAYLAAHPPTARTPGTIVRIEALQAEFTLIRERGYALDHEEFQPGLTCLAMPLQGTEGRYAIGISAPTGVFQANFATYLRDVALLATGRAPT